MESKVAFLIICHKNQDQVVRLIERLKCDDSVVFTHIDRKSNIDIDSVKRAGSIVVSKRISGYLFDASLIDIELALLKESVSYAKKTGITFKYYCLLSGQDYPIHSAKYICNKLSTDYPKSFLDCTPTSNENWLFKRAYHTVLFTKIAPRIFYLASKQKNKFFRKAIKAPIVIYDKCFRYVSNCERKLKKNNIDVYGGSQWWILPDYLVDDIFDYVDGHKKEAKCIRNIYGQDETFFQTIIMNGKYSNTIDVNPPDETRQNSKTFCFFENEKGEVSGHPFVLSSKNYNLIMSKKDTHFFVRKVDTNIDEEILNIIDAGIEYGY